MSLAFKKDPDATLDYVFDWSAWLPSGDSIATAEVTAKAGITVISQSNTTTSVTVWLSGGTVNLNYEVTCHITTTAGRQDERTTVIQVVER